MYDPGKKLLYRIFLVFFVNPRELWYIMKPHKGGPPEYAQEITHN